MSPNDPIEKIRNLGEVSAHWLGVVGISTRGELEQVGVVEAYKRVERTEYTPSLNFLYAIFAGVEDMHWQEVTPEIKLQLKVQVRS